jgi:cellobiose phosphorylase
MERPRWMPAGTGNGSAAPTTRTASLWAAACNDEGQIYIEPQGMCVMAGIGVAKPGRPRRRSKACEKRLDSKYGIALLAPAYRSYTSISARSAAIRRDIRRTAASSATTIPWISCAETVLGHGGRAFEVYRKTCPAYLEDISEVHRTEPYVYSQTVAGPEAPRFGEAKNSWLTGTAAWTFTDVSQYLLGIRPSFGGLCVDPCIPSSLRGFRAERQYRGAKYHITVDNSAGVQKGVASLTVNGRPVKGSCIPYDPSVSEYTVTAVMGRRE